MSYYSYHTDLKLLVLLGILPHHIEAQIPKSTRYRFKKFDPSSLFGFQELENLREIIDLIQKYKDYKDASKILKAGLFLQDTKIKILTTAKKNQK